MAEDLVIRAAPPEDVDPRALEPAPADDVPAGASAAAEPPAVSVETVRTALDWLFRGEAVLMLRAGREDLAVSWPLTKEELDWAAPIIAGEINARPQLRRLFRGAEVGTNTWYGVLATLHIRRIALVVFQRLRGGHQHGTDSGASAAGSAGDAAPPA